MSVKDRKAAGNSILQPQKAGQKVGGGRHSAGGSVLSEKRGARKTVLSWKRKKRKQEKSHQTDMPDYGRYIFTRLELLTQAGVYVGLCGVVSFLFFRSLHLMIIMMPGFYLFLKVRRKEFGRRRQTRMCSEFLIGMQLVSTALQSGYAVENAFREALVELRKIYEDDSFIVSEFRHITTQVRLNHTIESLLMSLGERTHVEDIRNFSEVFLAAKRTGGDLMAVIRNTVACMQQKEETISEIDTVLAGKKMEQNIMSLIPMLILAYITLTSPDSLDSMYHTSAGIVIMSICLVIYVTAYLWGRKIMSFDV